MQLSPLYEWLQNSAVNHNYAVGASIGQTLKRPGDIYCRILINIAILVIDLFF